MKNKDYPFRLMSYAEARSAGVPKKRRCPQCGRKTFTLYVDREGRIIDPLAGRCDRQFSCQYHQKPHRPPQEQEGPPPLPCLYVPARVFERAQAHGPEGSAFGQALIAWANDVADPAGQEFARQSLLTYRCSSSPKNECSIVFWFINSLNNVTDGQIKMFSGLKTDKGQTVRWVHYSLREAGLLPRDSQRYRSLFGEHLLSGAKGQVVHIYEAPKTAIMMHCMCQILGLSGQIHVAAGALGWLNYMTRSNDQISRYRSLFAGCRRVVLWPDLSPNGKAAELWQEEAVRIQRYLNVAAECYASWADGLASDEDRAAGFDVADWLAYRHNRIGLRLEDSVLRAYPMSPRSADYEPKPLPPEPADAPKMPVAHFTEPPKQPEAELIDPEAPLPEWPAGWEFDDAALEPQQPAAPPAVKEVEPKDSSPSITPDEVERLFLAAGWEIDDGDDEEEAWRCARPDEVRPILEDAYAHTLADPKKAEQMRRAIEWHAENSPQGLPRSQGADRSNQDIDWIETPF